MPELVSAFLYRVFLISYSLFARISAFFYPKARLWVVGRRRWRDRLRADLGSSEGHPPVAWFHAASLGEFEQGRPVIEAFRERFPDYFILLTFFSPSGYEVRKNYGGADYVTYLPLDSPSAAKDFVAIVKPRIAFFIKYEFWYYYIRELKKRGVPLVSFSAIFRQDQLFFKSYGGFYRKILGMFDAVLVQNEASVELLEDIGIGSGALAGDTRYDRVYQLAAAARELPEIETFVKGGLCLVVGSAWPADMEVIIPVLNRMGQRLKVIVAPHEIKDREMAGWEQALGFSSVRYSEYAASGFDPVLAEDAQCLFIDNIGMLSSLYRYGSVAFIGGGFATGLHNILEAVTFGLPVMFGNRKYKKFQEAVDLVSDGVAYPVGGTEELGATLELLLGDDALRVEKGIKGRLFIERKMGATEQVMSRAMQLLA